eukprot:5580554-Amphidinium_carterae.1
MKDRYPRPKIAKKQEKRKCQKLKYAERKEMSVTPMRQLICHAWKNNHKRKEGKLAFKVA